MIERKQLISSVEMFKKITNVLFLLILFWNSTLDVPAVEIDGHGKRTVLQ